MKRSNSTASIHTLQRKPSIFDRSDITQSKSDQSKKNPQKTYEPLLEIPKNVREMHAEMLFDRKLREKATLIDDEKAAKNYKLQKKWLSGLKAVTIVLYYLLDPIF